MDCQHDARSRGLGHVAPTSSMLETAPAMRRLESDTTGMHRGRPGAALARRLRYRATVGVAALLGALVAPPAILAVEVQFPLTIEYSVLRAALRKHLGEETGGALELWRTPDGCGTFVVKDPVLEPADGRLRVTGPAVADRGASHARLVLRLHHLERSRGDPGPAGARPRLAAPPPGHRLPALQRRTEARERGHAALDRRAGLERGRDGDLQLRPRPPRRGGPAPSSDRSARRRGPGRGAPDPAAPRARGGARRRPAARRLGRTARPSRAAGSRARLDGGRDRPVGGAARPLGRVPVLPGQGSGRLGRRPRDADRASRPPPHARGARWWRSSPADPSRASTRSGPCSSASGIACAASCAASPARAATTPARSATWCSWRPATR